MMSILTLWLNHCWGSSPSRRKRQKSEQELNKMFIPKSQNQQCSKRKESANILIYKNPENIADTTSRAPEAVVPWAAEEEQLLVQVPLWHLWNVFWNYFTFFQKSFGEKITYLVSFLRSSSWMAHTTMTAAAFRSSMVIALSICAWYYIRSYSKYRKPSQMAAS